MDVVNNARLDGAGPAVSSFGPDPGMLVDLKGEEVLSRVESVLGVFVIPVSAAKW